MRGAGEWESLENGSRWRMVCAGEWELLENGSRWRIGVAGEWYALEIGVGRRQRKVVSREKKSPEKFCRFSPAPSYA